MARGGRVQEVRLQRARPLVRRRRGVRAAGCASTPTTASPSCRRCRSPRTTRRRSASPWSCSRRRFGLPRTDLFADAGRRDRALRAAPGDATACPTAAGSCSTRRRSAATRSARPATTTCSTCASCTSVLGDGHAVLLKLHPFVRDGARDPARARGVRDRRIGRSGPQRADARQRRAGDRLLERDLRVRAARPADRVPRPRRRRVRARARLLPRLSGATCPGRCSRRRPSSRRRSGPTPSTSSAVRAFAAASFDVVDGHATARIVDEVLLPALRGERGAVGRASGHGLRPSRPPSPRRMAAAATRSPEPPAGPRAERRARARARRPGTRRG